MDLWEVKAHDRIPHPKGWKERKRTTEMNKMNVPGLRRGTDKWRRVEETQVLSAALLKLNAGVLFIREGWQEIMRVKKKECKWSEEISSIFHLLKCHTFILQYSFYIIFKSPREHTMSCSLHNDLGLYLLFFVILDMSIDLSVILLFIIIIYFSSLHLLL